MDLRERNIYKKMWNVLWEYDTITKSSKRKGRIRVRDTDQREEHRTLADRLREARERAGLSPEALAQQLEVSPEEYAQWEAGTVQPDTAAVGRAAKILHVTGNYLLFGLTREGMVGAMFPNKAVPEAVPGWYKGMLVGAALLFCGGAGALLLLFVRKAGEETGELLSFLPFWVFLGIFAVGALACIVSGVLRSRVKKHSRHKEKGNDED